MGIRQLQAAMEGTTMTRLWSIIYDERRYTSEVFRDPDDRRDTIPIYRGWPVDDLEQYVGVLRSRKWEKFKAPQWYWHGDDFYQRPWRP